MAMFTALTKFFQPKAIAETIPTPTLDHVGGSLPSRLATIPLSATPNGHRVRIVSLECGNANCRLMGMGLVPGAALDIVQCATNGCIVVALHNNRMGFDSEMAKQIHVIDEGKSAESLPTEELNKMKLREATVGTKVKIVGYEPTAREYKRKLLAMGLTPNTELLIKRVAPLGDPIEIEVRGYHLSLRKAEADALIVSV